MSAAWLRPNVRGMVDYCPILFAVWVRCFRIANGSAGRASTAPNSLEADLEWWMDAAGVLDERYDEVDDIARARRVASLQLADTPDRSTLDINALTEIGVKIVGRLGGISENGKVQFSGSCATCARFPILRWEDC